MASVRRRAAIATTAGLGLILAVIHPWAPRPETHRIYLPRVEQRQARSVPPTLEVPAPRIILRPADPEALYDALGVTGARVEPAPGIYRLGHDARIAPRVTLDGRGAVEIRWHGLDLDGAEGAEILGLSLRDCKRDCITVQRAPGALIQDVTVHAPSGDGLIDVIRTSGQVTIRDVRLIGGHAKCMLIGHQWHGEDAELSVLLERVEFDRCYERVPKVHRATVTLRGVTIRSWSGNGIDVQLGGVVVIDGVTWEPGPKSHERWQTSTGGTVVEVGR